MPAIAVAPSTATAAKPTRLPGGLLYVSPEMPGLSRIKRGKRFRYRMHDGAWVQDAEEIARIDKLAIPPAYTGVWICPLPNGHLQATGLDARGRKQYRYHPDWRLQRDESKFDRLEAFGRALPRIRARVARDLRLSRGQPVTRTVLLATLVRLLDTTYIRVGNEEYAASNGSYGLTTLRNPHAGVKGSVLRLRFRGKSGVMQEAELDDPRVARVVRRCQQLPGQELFQYEDEDGTPHAVDSADVNAYLAEAAGLAADEPHFTAKDFRTWHGTVQALELTRMACTSGGAEAYNAKAVLSAVARQLGNTPAVCKKSYIHPAVMAIGATLASDQGPKMADIWNRIASKQQRQRKLHAAEHRLMVFLQEHRRGGRTRRRTTAPKAGAS
ncbi:DNA topoisomerase IB [uncultured Xylophilus sp.]|uniref:DNA topoisomerase IB n=1 Tax=uncultured Xylophilus sp. TaxID=296832 RepID=UPI0025E54D1D|nr:DNA topoisomerase IB [uncultured Xylophilus sp.]